MVLRSRTRKAPKTNLQTQVEQVEDELRGLIDRADEYANAAPDDEEEAES